jgi:hypothetical protein
VTNISASVNGSTTMTELDIVLCNASSTTLCLQDGRFSVTANFAVPNGPSGPATAIPFADKSGFFWFFNPSNTELDVKVIDTHTTDTAGNENFWVYYGGLTDVPYSLTVTDLKPPTRTKTYNNYAAGKAVCGGEDTSFPGNSIQGWPDVVKRTPGFGPAPGSCTPSANTLCLATGRDTIKVETVVMNPFNGQLQNATGGLLNNTGAPQPGGFFDLLNNGEADLIVKVIDSGPKYGNYYWIYTGSVTDMAYTMTLTNVTNGNFVKITNPSNNYCGSADISLLK